MEMSFWVVSGFGLGICVLDRSPGAPMGRDGFGGFSPIGLNGVFLHRNVFDLCVKC